ncbi:MAG TPA: hypothetical protein VHF26_08625, partial [Trebonia sp.]|nr:hypothetical protein [Trebonia sp.]
NGLLFRPGRADALADCLSLLGRDPALRARMGRASGRIIAEHDRHRVLSRWESLYCALRGAGPGGSPAVAARARGAAATNESR